MPRRYKNLRDLFPSAKSYRAFVQFAAFLRAQGNKVSVHHVSKFASSQAKAGVYNKANFYWYVITPLIEMGFIDKIPTWNNELKRTQYCYVPVFNDLPRHAVGRGYYRDAWYLCKEWNDLFFSKEETADSRRVSTEGEDGATIQSRPLSKLPQQFSWSELGHPGSSSTRKEIMNSPKVAEA